MDSVATEVQKLQKSLRLVSACKPSGMSENQILSMKIALHVGKIDKMSYDFKNLEHETWPLHLA